MSIDAAHQDAPDQAGAVPYRVREGRIEVLVVSSSRGYWLVPKGSVDPGEDQPAAAARETWEESGVKGEIDPDKLGTFTYEKTPYRVCVVDMYPLCVTDTAETWPEDHVRDRRWLDLEHAARVVRWPELGAIIRSLSERVTPQQR